MEPDPAGAPLPIAESAAFALGAVLSAAMSAMVGSVLADALGVAAIDVRFVAVALGPALVLLVARVLRAGPRGRLALLVLAAPFAAALAWPHSPIAVTWLSGAVLALGLDATVHAVRSAARLMDARLARVALGLVALAPSSYFLAAAAVVIVNTQLVLAPVRFAHLSAPLREGERLVTFTMDDGVRIEGTLRGGGGAPLVVLHHGVSDGRRRLAGWADRLAASGVGSLRYDARAHGRSGGAVCTYGQREARDLAAIVEELDELVPGHGPLSVVGASMGGGTVLAASPALVQLGVRRAVVLAPASRYGELVVQRTAILGPMRGPILNASARLATAMGQVPMTAWNPADHLDARLSLLVLHGTADRTIPIAQSRRLAERANVRLIELPGVGHDEIPRAVLDDAVAWSRVVEHLGTDPAR